jgi:hypothetical protein
MKPLPLPVRIAAGLVATAVDQARDLPRLVVEFPVTAVSQALQVTMRVQQKVTELAIKGDRALGTLRPVEEKPSWATFDDDEGPLAGPSISGGSPRRNGASTVTELRPQVPRTSTPIPVAQPPARRPAAAPAGPKPAAAKTATPKTAAAKTAAPQPAAAESAAPKPAAPKPAALKPAAPKPAAPKPAAAKSAAPKPAAPEPAASASAASAPAASTPDPAPATTPDPATPELVAPKPDAPEAPPAPAAETGASAATGTGDGPAAMPGYPALTIPQLRGKLRFLSAADLTALRDWETSHGNRAPYLTMLSNRIATVTES